MVSALTNILLEYDMMESHCIFYSFCSVFNISLIWCSHFQLSSSKTRCFLWTSTKILNGRGHINIWNCCCLCYSLLYCSCYMNFCFLFKKNILNIWKLPSGHFLLRFFCFWFSFHFCSCFCSIFAVYFVLGVKIGLLVVFNDNSTMFYWKQNY